MCTRLCGLQSRTRIGGTTFSVTTLSRPKTRTVSGGAAPSLSSVANTRIGTCAPSSPPTA